MNFTNHTRYVGQHAFLSPSNYHWVNYDEDKLDRIFFTQLAARRGVELHAFANQAIRLGIRLPDSPMTLNQYVNDAIGYRMTPEQGLFYSDNCFGTADSIGFRNNTLRVHDLKTGTTEASFMQLKVYVALFCLEYHFKPLDIKAELRIYQNDDVRVEIADPDEIFHVMDRIITFDKRLKILKAEVGI